jgi:HD-like signal output (HDOD) protein
MKQLTENHQISAVSKKIDGLWHRSIRMSAISGVVAKNCSNLNPESAMIAGLLHDTGKFYILSRANNYRELFSDEAALWDLVDRWHHNIGASILESWKVPDDIRAAVLEQEDPERDGKGSPDLIDVVAAADILDRHFQPGIAKQIDWTSPPRVLTSFNLDQGNSELLMQKAKDEIESIFQAIS